MAIKMEVRKDQKKGEKVEIKSQRADTRRQRGRSNMADTEKTEIYTTEYIDKELPRIVYEKKIVHNMTESESIYITISDKTSKAALHTFKELGKEVAIGEIKHEPARPLVQKPGGKAPGTVLLRRR